jgi:hypothetical protein
MKIREKVTMAANMCGVLPSIVGRATEINERLPERETYLCKFLKVEKEKASQKKAGFDDLSGRRDSGHWDACPKLARRIGRGWCARAGEPTTFSPLRYASRIFDLARKCPGQISGEGRYPEF